MLDHDAALAFIIAQLATLKRAGIITEEQRRWILGGGTMPASLRP